MPLETEVKLRLAAIAPFEVRLKELGFRVHAPRAFESNVLLDTSSGLLRSAGQLIRLRRVGSRAVLTFKGPGQASRHKSREEVECEVADADAMENILARLGFNPVFRYEKYRTEYEREPQQGIVTIDETPIGLFAELEGSPAWIDRTAKALGFSEPEYITKSYGRLYLEYCRDNGIEPAQMVFGPTV